MIIHQYKLLATDIDQEERKKLRAMLELQPADFLAQQLCENPYQAIPKSELKGVKVDLKKIQGPIPGILENIQNFRQEQRVEKPIIDSECAKEFLEQFQIEKVNKKRSKYQTIINRFKEKQAELEGVSLNKKPTMDLNLSKILAAFTPSHDLYQQNRLELLSGANTSSPEKSQEKKSQIVPKIVRKLGLLTDKERVQQNIDKMSYEAYMMNQKCSSVSKKSKSKFINQPLSIIQEKLKSSRIIKTANQSKSLLHQFLPQISQDLSKVNSSLIDSKNETFNKVQSFCKNVDDYAQQIHGEQLMRQQAVSQTMKKIKQNFQNWEYQMKDRGEVLEYRLAEEIKQEVMGVKKKRKGLIKQ